MARTKQKLINYHSSGASNTNTFNPANVEYGEIAVRHIPSEPRLYVRTGEDTYATFVDSAQTIVMIDEKNQNTIVDLNNLSGCLIAVSGAFVTLSGDFQTVSAQVVTNKQNITTLANEFGTHKADFEHFSGYVLENYSAWTNTKEYIDNQNANLINNINYVSGSVSAFSAYVVTNYATNTQVANASANAITSAKTYIDTASGNIESTFGNYATSADTYNAIDAVKTSLDTTDQNLSYVSGGLYAFSAKVVTDFATKTEVASASANAISSAKTYIDAASGNIESTFGNYATSAHTHDAIQSVKTSLENRIDGVDTKVNQLSGSVTAFSATVVSMEDDLIDRIESALTVVYKFKGTVTNYSDLANISNPQNGDVYNVVNAQGTIGEPGYTPPGTNYAWVAPNGDDPEEEGYVAGHWDELGGQVDLSNYVTQGQLSAATATTENVMNAVYYVSGQVSAFSSTVVTQYATKTETASASANAISSAKTYIDAASGNIVTFFSGNYATSANTYNAIEAVKTSVDDVVKDIKYVSGGLYAFSAKVVTDFATKAEVASASASAVSSAKTYIDAASGSIESTFGEYAKSADTHNAIGVVDTKVENVTTDLGYVSGNVVNLSGSVISVKETADAALNEFKLGTVSNPTTTQSGAKASYVTGGSATLDLSELVIDCGDF